MSTMFKCHDWINALCTPIISIFQGIELILFTWQILINVNVSSVCWYHLYIRFVCVVDNLYVTEETTTWANISKNCQLARPAISINQAGHFVVSDHDFIRLHKIFGRLNESVWINYFSTYGTFQYTGKIYLEPSMTHQPPYTGHF